MSFAEASKEFVAADKKLQAAAKPDEKRAAALEFANAERVARSAKARENDSAVLSLLK
jgi:hypothetical protein